MTELHPVTPLLTAEYKAVRLRALKDTPLAFGSTYARESQFTDIEWNARAERLTNERNIGFLAYCDGSYAGLALCFVDAEDCTRGQIISMWVAPEVRRLGVGRQLIAAIASWAGERGVRTLHLMVTSVNDSAMKFYRRIGFTPSGKTEPYPNDPNILEYEMVREIA
jgi:ribosomal protein S18 acetylase RimI-like enzyme